MKIPAEHFENQPLNVRSEERGDISIIVGEGTFPVKYIEIHPEDAEDGNTDIYGSFSPYENLSQDEERAFMKETLGIDGRTPYFRIIINSPSGIVEPMLKCKVYKTNQDGCHFMAAEG